MNSYNNTIRREENLCEEKICEKIKHYYWKINNEIIPIHFRSIELPIALLICWFIAGFKNVYASHANIDPFWVQSIRSNQMKQVYLMENYLIIIAFVFTCSMIAWIRLWKWQQPSACFYIPDTLGYVHLCIQYAECWKQSTVALTQFWFSTETYCTRNYLFFPWVDHN